MDQTINFTLTIPYQFQVYAFIMYIVTGIGCIFSMHRSEQTNWSTFIHLVVFCLAPISVPLGFVLMILIALFLDLFIRHG